MQIYQPVTKSAEMAYFTTSQWKRRDDIHKVCPYYHLVPKGIRENLAWRRDILALGYENHEAAKEIWMMCARDILFYINTFGYIYSPGKVDDGEDPIEPLITFPFQDDAILDILEHVKKGRDILVEKSRCQGASWISLCVLEHQWHFFPMRTFLLASRTEDLVDSSGVKEGGGNPDTLMWKLDFIHEHLPEWMKAIRYRTFLNQYNRDNGSTINGSSTNKDLGRGGRRLALLLDEFAAVENGGDILSATQQNAKCRIMVSTSKGAETAFAKQKQKSDSLYMHWSMNPLNNYGLYQVLKDGSINVIDREWHEKNPGYKFNPNAGMGFGRYDGLHSPWYDEECRRAYHPSLIAQELDMDDQGASFQFFHAEFLSRLKKQAAKDPELRGNMEYDPETLTPRRFVEDPNGMISLWAKPDASGDWPTDRDYTAGIDIGFGTGASNSTCTITDKKTGEQIAEMVSSRVGPESWAKLCVVLCRWFKGMGGRGAFMIWENNGPAGELFGNKIKETDYRNIYYNRNTDKITDEITEKPGHYNGKKQKYQLLCDFREAIECGAFTPHSKPLVEEMAEFVYLPGNAVAHIKSTSKLDPTGNKDAHADRVIAAALSCMGMKAKPHQEVEKQVEIPYLSPLWRMLQREREAELAEAW